MTEETGHWYTRDGSPAYFTNGRGTTLRDARKLSLVPSVTTVLNVIAKPALTNWLVMQGIMAALTGTRQLIDVGPDNPPDGAVKLANGNWAVQEGDETYIKRILKDSKAQAKAAAEEGSRIHDAIEQSFQIYDVPYLGTYRPHVEATRLELVRLFPGVTDWVSEKPFAHPMGFGGKVDLHSPSTGIVVDFKTKDGDFSDGKRLAYDQNIQLAAYQMGLLLRCTPNQICANIFVSRTHPGCVSSVVWTPEQVASGWRIFELALALCKETSGYDGAF